MAHKRENYQATPKSKSKPAQSVILYDYIISIKYLIDSNKFHFKQQQKKKIFGGALKIL